MVQTADWRTGGAGFAVYTYTWATGRLRLLSTGVIPSGMHCLAACLNDGSVCYGWAQRPDVAYGDAFMVDSGGHTTGVGKYYDLLTNDLGLFGIQFDGTGNIRVRQIAAISGRAGADFVIPRTFRHGVSQVGCADDGYEWVIVENHASGKPGGASGLLEELTDPLFTEVNLKVAIWNRRQRRMSRTYDFTSLNILDFQPRGVILSR